jgi:hypothetical protein
MTKNKKQTPARPKGLYRIRNWSAYDQALVNRGSLTICLSEDAITRWKAHDLRQRGAQKLYSDFAILTALTIT